MRLPLMTQPGMTRLLGGRLLEGTTHEASDSLIMASNSCFPCKQVGDEAGRGRPRGVRALGGAAGPARGAPQLMDVGEVATRVLMGLGAGLLGSFLCYRPGL